MNEETGANGFSEHHQRHVRTTFQYIDKLLSEAEHIMADAGSPSPFGRYSDDTTPIQRKVTHDYILRIREAMRRVMDELNIPPSEPHSGALWAAAINLTADRQSTRVTITRGPPLACRRRRHPCRAGWISSQTAKFPGQRRRRRSATAASTIRQNRP